MVIVRKNSAVAEKLIYSNNGIEWPQFFIYGNGDYKQCAK